MDYNTIIQGDSLQVLKTLPDESVNCCVTSPPYHNGKSPYKKYIKTLCDIFDQVKRVLINNGVCWVVIGSESDLMIPEQFAIEMMNRGWIKGKTRIWYRPVTMDFDYVYLFTKQPLEYKQPTVIKEKSDDPILRLERLARKLEKYKEKHNIDICWLEEEVAKLYIDSVEDSIWEIKGEYYPAFPEALIEPMIQAGCPKGGIVIDPFGGALTTCVVAKKQGKRYIAIELKPEYIEMGKRRLEKTLYPNKLF